MKVREILELLWCRGVDVGEENTNDVIKERVKTAQVSVALASLAEEVGRLREYKNFNNGFEVYLSKDDVLKMMNLKPFLTRNYPIPKKSKKCRWGE